MLGKGELSCQKKQLTTILCLLGLLACDGLDTEPREMIGIAWEEYPFEVDLQWVFQSSKETDKGIDVLGAWKLTLRNTSDDEWKVHLIRVGFVDGQGFQVAEHHINESFVVEGQESSELQGNFDMQVASIQLANSISGVTVWAKFVAEDNEVLNNLQSELLENIQNLLTQ